MVKKNILVFVAYANNNPHFETELEIIQNHLDQGDKVTVLACNNHFSTCDINFSHNMDICLQCMSRRLQGFDLLSEEITVKPIYNLAPENQQELEQLQGIYFQNIEQIKQFKIDNFDLGYGVLSSLVSILRNPEPDLLQNSKFIELMSISALAVYRSVQNYLLHDDFERIYVYNGRYALMRAAFRAAQSKKIDCYLHERGATFKKYSLTINALPHDIKYISTQIQNLWNKAPREKREIIGRQFFIDKSNNISHTWKSFTKYQQQGLLPSNWDNSKVNIVIFNSSDDEFVAIGDIWQNRIYEDQLDGIKKIIKALENETNVNIYIRVHPNLQQVNNKQKEILYSLKSKNLTIIPAESKVSSYTLLNYASKVVTFGSTMGIEAVYWRIPSILLGPTFYRDLGGTYNPQTHEEVINLVKTDLKPKDIKSALMYGYYNLTHGIDFKHYHSSDIFEGNFTGVDLKPNIKRMIENIGISSDHSTSYLENRLQQIFYFSNENQNEKAWKMLDQFECQGLQTPNLNYLKAVILARLGDIKKAQEYLQQLLLENSTHKKAKILLNQLKNN